MSKDPLIRSVADTALWMAEVRARETARSDAVFQDPFAGMLAGARGRRLADRIPGSAAVSWGLVVRTAAIDRLVLEAIEAGADLVLNLGAGMDTRPYRLAVPARLPWIEADLPGLIESKDQLLRDQPPACRVERIGLDLEDSGARARLLAQAAAQARRPLVIAEGLIPYLSNAAVAAIAHDLASLGGGVRWLLDFENAGRRPPPRRWLRLFEAAPFRFAVDDWFRHFAELGWRPRHVITSAEESERIARPFPFTVPSGLLLHALPKPMRRKVLEASGAVLLELMEPQPPAGGAPGSPRHR